MNYNHLTRKIMNLFQLIWLSTHNLTNHNLLIIFLLATNKTQTKFSCRLFFDELGHRSKICTFIIQVLTELTFI